MIGFYFPGAANHRRLFSNLSVTFSGLRNNLVNYQFGSCGTFRIILEEAVGFVCCKRPSNYCFSRTWIKNRNIVIGLHENSNQYCKFRIFFRKENRFKTHKIFLLKLPFHELEQRWSRGHMRELVRRALLLM